MSDSTATAPRLAVTPEHAAAINRQGWVVIRQVFSPEEQPRILPVLHDYVTAIRTRATSLDAVPFGSAGGKSGPPGETDPASPASRKTAFNLEDAPAEVVRIITSARLGEIAARLLGVEGVRVMHFSGLVKPAGEPGTPLHQDLSYLPIDTDRNLTIWIPLTDIEVDMGPLIFASGSHTAGQIDDPVSVRGRFPFMHTGPMKAGDVSVHLGWTIHGSLKNASGRSRDAFGISYYRDGTRIQRHGEAKFLRTLMGSCFAGLNPGDLAVGPRNPLVYPVPSN
jgi:Phytanoyl-CoA dioxygenase (PhyH)